MGRQTNRRRANSPKAAEPAAGTFPKAQVRLAEKAVEDSLADRNAPALNGVLLDKRAVADLFGVTPRTIEQWVNAGRIPAIRLSPRCIRFSKEKVLEHVAEHFSTV